MRRMIAGIVALSLLLLPVRGAQAEKYVSLTFDDGPSGRYTRRLLDGLSERGVKATFLLCGYRMKDYPDITQRIYEEGHEIGFHGYSHDPMSTMSRRQIAQELMDTEKLLPEGCRPVFLRPPGGGTGDAVRQVAQVRLLGLLNWSVDPKDWQIHDAPRVIERVLSQVQDGDVVLMHDMSDSSVTAALEIVDALKARGYTMVTVSQMAKLRNIRIRPGEQYRCFPQK